MDITNGGPLGCLSKNLEGVDKALSSSAGKLNDTEIVDMDFKKIDNCSREFSGQVGGIL